MAEGNTANENSENKLNEIVKSNQKYITPTFNNTDLFYLLFAFAILIADITTGQSKIYNSFVFVLYSTGVFPTTSPALSRVRENSKLTVAVFFCRYHFNCSVFNIWRNYLGSWNFYPSDLSRECHANYFFEMAQIR